MNLENLIKATNSSKEIIEFCLKFYKEGQTLQYLKDNTWNNIIFYCSNNQLTSLVIPDNFTCNIFNCYNNQLTSLVIPDNFTCNIFDCSDNQLTSLVIPDNFTCNIFYCYNNQLTSLVIPDNFTCNIFDCSNNQLTSLILNKDLYIGNTLPNIEIKNYKVIENSSLEQVYKDSRFNDFSDGIISEILSKEKKVIYNNKYIQIYKIFMLEGAKYGYLCKYENYTSHGKTIREAVNDIIFKMSDKDKQQYKNIDKNKKYKVEELVIMYRIITGACSLGCETFLDSQGELPKTMNIFEVAERTKGNYGNETFCEFFNL
ncbi:MAG: hypothetical protein LBM96_06085 [Methanobrevibacter sp.]|jgi:hypothetical protein|nr:hypothetical protein [Candidatus Methanoflexus mossambicus]